MPDHDRRPGRKRERRTAKEAPREAIPHGTAVAALTRLAARVRELFPEDAAGHEQDSGVQMVEVAIDLLERLWRWSK